MTTRLRALSVALVLVSILAHPGIGHAQSSAGGENPMGFALGIGTGVSVLLAAPLFEAGHVPRPGSGTWHVGLGYQSAPDSVAAVSSAGGYFEAATWLGLEARFDSRIDASTGIDLNLDGAYLLLLRPTPTEWPAWIELLAGPSLETAFGGNVPAYITGGPSGGVRVGFGISFDQDTRFVVEGEALYNARFGSSYDGVRHQLEAAGRMALMFNIDGEETEEGEARDGEMGVAVDYRHERLLGSTDPALQDTHRLTIGAIMAF